MIRVRMREEDRVERCEGGIVYAHARVAPLEIPDKVVAQPGVSEDTHRTLAVRRGDFEEKAAVAESREFHIKISDARSGQSFDLPPLAVLATDMLVCG